MKGKTIKRNAEFSKASKKITSLVNECKENFRAQDDSKTWHAYLEYVDEIIITGLLNVVATSVGYILDETDPKLTHGILFEVKLELEEPDIIFKPGLDKNIVNNFYDQVNGYCDDIMHCCTIIPRIASHRNK